MMAVAKHVYALCFCSFVSPFVLVSFVRCLLMLFECEQAISCCLFSCMPCLLPVRFSFLCSLLVVHLLTIVCCFGCRSFAARSIAVDRALVLYD